MLLHGVSVNCMNPASQVVLIVLNDKYMKCLSAECKAVALKETAFENPTATLTGDIVGNN